MAAAINFPNAWTRIFSASVHFVGSCILTFVLARRTAFENLDTLRGWRELGTAKLSVILAFADSLLFLLLTGILTHGSGLELSHAACSTAFFACVFLYASSKVFIYNFLTERVWVVWSSTWLTSQPKRWKSPLYLCCIASESLYAVVVTLALCLGVTESGTRCFIGIRIQASLILLGYDCYMNILLTSFFVYPLLRESVLSQRLRKMAIRTLVAALIALTTSTLNIAVLTYFHGRERGWLCLLCCSTDVAINSLVIYSITRSRRVRRWRGYQGRMSTKPAQQDTYAEENRAQGGSASRASAIDGGGDGGIGDFRVGNGLRSIAWTTQDKDQRSRSSSQSRFPRHALSLNLSVRGGGLMSEKSYPSPRFSFRTRRRHSLSLEDEDDDEGDADADGDGDTPSKVDSSRDLEHQGHSVHEEDDDYDDRDDQDFDDEEEDDEEDEHEDGYEDGDDYITAGTRRQPKQTRSPQEFIVRAPRPRRSIDSVATSTYSLSSGYTMYAVYPDNDDTTTSTSTPDTSAPPSASSPTMILSTSAPAPASPETSEQLSLSSPPPSLQSPPPPSQQMQTQPYQPGPVHVHPFPPYSVHDTVHADLAFARRNSARAATFGEIPSSLSSPPFRPLHHSSSYPPSSSRPAPSPHPHPTVPGKRSRTRSRGRDRSGRDRDPKRGSSSAPEPSSNDRVLGQRDKRARFLSLTEALAELDHMMPSPPPSVAVSRNYHRDRSLGPRDNGHEVEPVPVPPQDVGPSSSLRGHSVFGIPFQFSSSPFGSIPKPKPKPKVPP